VEAYRLDNSRLRRLDGNSSEDLRGDDLLLNLGGFSGGLDGSFSIDLGLLDGDNRGEERSLSGGSGSGVGNDSSLGGGT
jgi:hypothetical protein